MQNRPRATAIIIHKDKILLMKRNKYGKKYYAFIGGGVEQGEDPKNAAVRETYEETSVKINIDKQLKILDTPANQTHFVYLGNYISGEPMLQKGTNEFNSNAKGKNTYQPIWINIADLKKLIVYPEFIKTFLLNNESIL